MNKKNTVIRVNITDLNPDGNGVGRTEDGRVVFVPLTAPGDVCEAKVIKESKGYLVARLEKLIAPSPYRIEPDCAVFNKCGGCSFRHITYEKEKELKESMVRNAFLRIAGIDVKVNPLISVNNTHYRNKVQYPITENECGSLTFGFYARHSHRVIAHECCLLQDDVFSGIASRLIYIFTEKGLSAYNEQSGKGLLRHIYIRKTITDEISVCVVVNGDNIPDGKRIAQLIQADFPQIRSFFVNINKKKSNVILGDKNILISGQSHITDILCGRSFELSPNSFFQVNNRAAEKLYEKAAEYAALEKADILLDLYCGTGSVGLCIAENENPLCGAEIVEEAVKNAKNNAVNNGRSEDNTLFVCGDAKIGITECRKHLGDPSVIVVDPPRKGLNPDLITDIASARPKRIVYISCNPATLARDTSLFAYQGYRPEEATPFDLFPRTGHVECCVLMSRVKE